MRGRLLIVGWAGVGWSHLRPLLDELPCLGRLVEEGISGPLQRLEPAVPPLLWTSLATGRHARQHGVCHHFRRASDPAALERVTAADVKAPAFWHLLAAQGVRPIVAGWPVSHGDTFENGNLVSDRYPEPTAGPAESHWPPAPAGTYSPDDLAGVLDPLRVSPAEIDAEVLSALAPRWREVVHEQNERLAQLRLSLAADFSSQAAATHLMTETAWDCAAICFSGITRAASLFLPFHVAGETDGAHPFAHVFREYVRILDQMLARLIALAGEDCDVLVVSPFSFEANNASDPAPSGHGIFIGHGPRLAPDALLHGAGILDLVPSVLARFDVPIPRSLQGRVLIEAFREPPAIQWNEEVVALLPKPTEPNAPPATPHAIEWDWNLARACLDEGCDAEAHALLERLCAAFPERADFQHALFQKQLREGATGAAEETLEPLLESIPPGPLVSILKAELAIAMDDQALARQLVKALPPERYPHLAERSGLLLLRLREWKDVERLARSILEKDTASPIAWLGLGEALIRRGEALPAAQAAIEAIRRRYFFPEAHLLLARTLAAQKIWLAAIQAVEALLRMQPGNAPARSYLRRLRKIIPGP